MKMKYVVPLAAVVLTGTIAFAVTTQRYLHVRVNNPMTHESVRVNVPLSLAEAVIPAIDHNQLHKGKVRLGHIDANGVNLKQLMEALKTAPEGEFVTVQENEEDVRVAKEHNQLVVHVVDKGQKKAKENVDVTIPWSVAQALASNIDDDNQLNIVAGIKALEEAGDVTLVSVADGDETVRVWVDSNSASE